MKWVILYDTPLGVEIAHLEHSTSTSSYLEICGSSFLSYMDAEGAGEIVSVPDICWANCPTFKAQPHPSMRVGGIMFPGSHASAPTVTDSPLVRH